MPGDRPDDSDEEFPPNLSAWQRRVIARSRRKQARDKAPLADRLRDAVLKPVSPDAAAVAAATGETLSVEELTALDKSATDKERLVGLIAAPLAAAIGILITSALIADDPPAHLKNGALNKLHVAVSTYHTLTVVVLALSVVILVTAMLRKRVYMGIATALYGLTIFNLHFWGFGIPFILCAAWYLVRAYRIHRDWREATGDGPSSRGSGMPRPNKRYTPPVSSPRALRPRPANAKRAG